MFFSYHSRENTRYAGTQIAPATIDPGGWSQDFTTHYLRTGWIYTISPTMVNTLNIGYNRTNSINVTPAALQASSGSFSWAERLGLTNITGTAAHQFPNVRMGEGILGLGTGNQDDLIDNGLRFNQQLSWIRGRHSLAFGADVRTQLFAPASLGTDAGVYNFAELRQPRARHSVRTLATALRAFCLGISPMPRDRSLVTSRAGRSSITRSS